MQYMNHRAADAGFGESDRGKKADIQGEKMLENPSGKYNWNGLRRILLFLILIAILPLILIYVFAFSNKTAPEYACAMRTAEQSRQVVSVTGEPIQRSLFAWTTYFESGGGLRQGSFITYLSGPHGGGTITVEFYRTLIGETLGVWFKTGGEEMEIHDGAYPCPDEMNDRAASRAVSRNETPKNMRSKPRFLHIKLL